MIALHFSFFPLQMKVLILDAAPIIKSLHTLPPAEKYFTVPEVLGELKDQKTIQALDSFAHQIETKIPSPEAIRYGIFILTKSWNLQRKRVIFKYCPGRM
jgi:rRNA maturation endonuclease Nob1